MTPGVQALTRLTALGYRFKVEGENILAEYQGPGTPNPHLVRPLLEVVKTHKRELVEFLRCFCPKCGGVVFATFDNREVCLACHYQAIKSANPGLGLKH